MSPGHNAVTDDASPDGCAPSTSLPRLFGDNARMKIVAALLNEREHDLNVSDIARLAGVARTTVYDHIDELQQLGIVVQTREVSGGPMYQMHNDDEIVEHLTQIQGLAQDRLEDDT